MGGPILYPTDFSDNSRPALDYASTLAAFDNRPLHIVHVSEALPTPDHPVPQYHTAPSIIDAEISAREQLDELQPTRPSVACVRKLLHGDPAKEIVEYAQDKGVDLVVMGTHGRTGLLKMLMGSVAEAVVREAPCPVIVVKSPASEES